MKRELQLITILLLWMLGQSVFAQNGTADGIYDFRNLGVDNSGGAGFKKQGDKFIISNVGKLDPSDNSLYYGFRPATKGLQGDLVIKAEGGNICKRFTLKDMGLYTFASESYQKWIYTKFVITLKNEFGGTIASHQISSNVEIGKNAIVRLKDIPFSTAWPAAGYSAVASVELSYIASGEHPEILGFSNMNISNVSAGSLPVSYLAVSASLRSGNLKVDWITQSEANNDRFIVQASSDGNKWIDLGTVVTKAGNGNSSAKLDYHFGIPLSQGAFAGLGLLGLLLLPAARNRCTKLAVVALTLSVLISCAKDNVSLLDREVKGSKVKSMYVRIAQVDRDGTVSYSDIVSVKE